MIAWERHTVIALSLLICHGDVSLLFDRHGVWRLGATVKLKQLRILHKVSDARCVRLDCGKNNIVRL
jgi:hypothetical protein